jgi:hypothetical protein
MSYAILIKTYHKNLLNLKDGFAFLKYSLLFVFKKYNNEKYKLFIRIIFKLP